jgi:hypothetical protein
VLGSSRRPAPESEDGLFTYRLHLEDGSDIGEATYPSRVKIGEELFFGGGRRFRVLDVVTFEEDESPFVGLLQIVPSPGP